MNRGHHLRRVGIALVAIVGVGAIGAQISQAKLSTASVDMADGNLAGCAEEAAGRGDAGSARAWTPYVGARLAVQIPLPQIEALYFGQIGRAHV